MESLIIPRLWVFEEVRSMGMGNVKFHIMGILWGKLIYSHTMGFEYISIEFKNPHNSQIWETSFHRFPNVWEYFFPIHGK